MDIYEVFVTVVESGNFAAAAKQLGVTSSAVSKQMSRLEKQLGAQLFTRTTRSLALTEPGAFCFEKANTMIQQRRDMEHEITKFQDTPTGVLKVTSTPAFGEHCLIDIIAGFQKQFPDITIDLSLTGETEDIVKKGIDVAIREGQLKDSNLIARRLADYRTVVCASPEYLSGNPIEGDLDVLQQKVILLSDKDTLRWVARTTGIQERDFKDIVLKLNSMSAIRNAVLAGMGVSFLPSYLVKDDLRAGRLVEVRLDAGLPERDIFAVYSANRGAPGKVRSFIDYIVEYLSQTPKFTLSDSVLPPNVEVATSGSSDPDSTNQTGDSVGGEPFRRQACA